MGEPARLQARRLGERGRLFLPGSCLETLKPAGAVQGSGKLRAAGGEQRVGSRGPFERRARRKGTHCWEVSGLMLVEVTP